MLKPVNLKVEVPHQSDPKKTVLYQLRKQGFFRAAKVISESPEWQVLANLMQIEVVQK